MNALDVPLKEALREALASLETDRSCRAVVLAGAGRAFCAGQDLRAHVGVLDSGHSAPLDTVRRHYNPIASRLGSMPKPVIAAGGGKAVGAGRGGPLLDDFPR